MVIISDVILVLQYFFSYRANLDTILIIDAYVFFLLSSLLGEWGSLLGRDTNIALGQCDEL